MHKQDFILLADTIAKLPHMTTRDDVARAIAVAIMDSNKRFDMPKFLAACRKPFSPDLIQAMKG